MARRWFTRRGAKDNFEKYAVPMFAGKPISYLEVGNYQGMSLSWVAKNILTHPDSRGIGVDPYLPMLKHDAAAIEAVRDDCLRAIDPYPNVELVRAKSIDYLMGCAKDDGPFDFIYLDGSHFGPAVMTDAIFSWQHLNVGGMLIFDDFNMRKQRQRHNNIKRTIEQFTLCFERHIEIIFTNYQLGLIKTSEMEQEIDG